MPVKVSVVVATFSPGDRIEGLVRSLDAQTMPRDEFEVVFVDDGSPDEDTWPRLERIRDERDNVRIERIENSGWPSRPRNVGLDLARGEYVLFMDHDDELYPRALEAGYAFAARTGADILNGKEIRTDQAKWGLGLYLANSDNAIDREEGHPLIPANPHKLFRRQFLLDHGIRFPEGRRVLWEDIFFAIDCSRHMKVVATMSDTPFYHWVRGGKTASSSYSSDHVEYWYWVRELVLAINERLGGEPHLHRLWAHLMLHQYRSRILAKLSRSLFSDPDELEHVRAVLPELLGHIPVELDEQLHPTHRGRAHLVRTGRWDLLPDLVAVDAGVLGISRTTDVGWKDGALVVRAETRWATPEGTSLRIRMDGDRVVRDLPDALTAVLPDAAVDMTAAIEDATGLVAVRHRETAIVWPLASSSHRPRIDTFGGRPELVLEVEAVLDPATAAFGSPLEPGTWDVSVRNQLLGTVNQRALRTMTEACTAVVDGHVFVAYRAKNGTLSFDVDQTSRSLTGSAELDPKRATLTVSAGSRSRWPLRKRSWAVDLRVPFTDVATDRSTKIACSATAGGADPVPAWIVADDDGVRLEATVEQKPGTHRLRLHVHDRDLDTGLDLAIGEDGAVRLRRHER